MCKVISIVSHGKENNTQLLASCLQANIRIYDSYSESLSLILKHIIMCKFYISIKILPHVSWATDSYVEAMVLNNLLAYCLMFK